MKDATHYFSTPEQRGFSQNVTVIPIELRKALDIQEYDSGAAIRKYAAESRCHNKPGTKKVIVNRLPAVTTCLNGVETKKPATTKTRRRSN